MILTFKNELLHFFTCNLHYKSCFSIDIFFIYSRVLDLEELRVKLKCKTSHILVGGADDDLIVNHSTKRREGITQKLVDRCVLVRHMSNNNFFSFFY